MASIDVFCKLCDTGDRSASIKLIVNGNKILNDDGAADFNFKEIFTRDAKIVDLYSGVFMDLTQYFLCNYNTCLILLGTRANLVPLFVKAKGTPGKELALINHIIEQLHNEFTKRDKRRQDRAHSNISQASSAGISKDEIYMNVYEIIDQQIKDLVVMSHSATSQISVIDTPEVADDDFDGVYVKNLKSYGFGSLTVKDLQIGMYKAFNESLLQKLNATSTNPCVVEFSLRKHIEGFDIPVKCWYRIIVIPYLPTVNKISEGNEGSKISRHTPVFRSVLTDMLSSNLSSSPPDSSSSALKLLLSDVFGGNCITKSLIVVDNCVSDVNTDLFKYVSMFDNILNYPVDNLPHVKGLLSKFRSKIRRLEKQISRDKNVNDAFIEELKGHIQLLDTNNNDICNDKLELEALYNDVKEKYSKIVASHSELSSKTVLSTAEKLKMSKETVELKMRTNKLQQEAEKQVYEMKNKLLLEQEEKSKLERSLAFERKLHEDLKEKYDLLKKDNEDVCEEYINLKSNFQSITTEYQEQVQINNDLNEMVKKLSFRKDQLSSEKSDLEIQQIKEFNEQIQKLSLALSSSGKTPVLTYPAPVKLQSRSAENDDITKLRENHFNELGCLEGKLFTLKKTLNENEEVISSYKQRLVQVTSKMLIIQDNKELMDNRLLEMETMLKNVSNEYRSRLQQYIQDVKEFIQNNHLVFDKPINENCIMQMDKMVHGLEESYKTEQTIHDSKVKDLSANYNHICNQHERVLIAYRLALHKCENTTTEIDDEISSYQVLLPDSNEIKCFQTKERNEIRTKLCIAEQRVKDLDEMVQSLREKLKIQEDTLLFKSNIASNDTEAFPWSGIQRKIQDFGTNVQRNLEKEKTELLTRCHLAEQQLEDCQGDMKEGFKRYQQEIDHLRQLLNGYEQQLVNNSHSHVHEQTATGFLPPIERNRPSYRPEYRR